MRISDWSSDVCSSDLPRIDGEDLPLVALLEQELHRTAVELVEVLRDADDGNRFRTKQLIETAAHCVSFPPGLLLVRDDGISRRDSNNLLRGQRRDERLRGAAPGRARCWRG